MIGRDRDLSEWTAESLDGILELLKDDLEQKATESYLDALVSELNEGRLSLKVQHDTFRRVFIIKPEFSEDFPEELKEQSDNMAKMAEELVKERLERMKLANILGTVTELETWTLDKIELIFSEAWSRLKESMDGELLKSLEEKKIEWKPALDDERGYYYLTYTEKEKIDPELREKADNITLDLKERILDKISEKDMVIASDRHFPGWDVFKMNTVLDKRWGEVESITRRHGVGEEIFSKFGWKVYHDDKKGRFHIGFEEYGETTDEQKTIARRVAAIASRVMRKSASH